MATRTAAAVSLRTLRFTHTPSLLPHTSKSSTNASTTTTTATAIATATRTSRAHPSRTARRTFVSLPSSAPTSFSETRILPYKHSSLYALIADIDSYSSFLPYCTHSKVTHWSKPVDNDASSPSSSTSDSSSSSSSTTSSSPQQNKWPSQADLTIGFSGLEETFTSRVYCIPNRVVEAVGGDARPTLPADEVAHHDGTASAPPGPNKVFTSLATTWTVKPFHYKPPTGRPQTDEAVEPARDQTEVSLLLDFQFANPVYGALGGTVAPKVAGVMIEAFEKRAKELLGGQEQEQGQGQGQGQK